MTPRTTQTSFPFLPSEILTCFSGDVGKVSWKFSGVPVLGRAFAVCFLDFFSGLSPAERTSVSVEDGAFADIGFWRRRVAAFGRFAGFLRGFSTRF